MRRQLTAPLLAAFAVLTVTVTSPAIAAEPAAPPPLEAADTAPPGTAPAPPVQPLASPGSTPAAAPVPSAALTTMPTDPGLTPIPPASRPKPFYRKHWFWGAVGLVVITGAIIGILSLQPADPAMPYTKLGDMRAF